MLMDILTLMKTSILLLYTLLVESHLEKHGSFSNFFLKKYCLTDSVNNERFYISFCNIKRNLDNAKVGLKEYM